MSLLDSTWPHSQLLSDHGRPFWRCIKRQQCSRFRRVNSIHAALILTFLHGMDIWFQTFRVVTSCVHNRRAQTSNRAGFPILKNVDQHCGVVFHRSLVQNYERLMTPPYGCNAIRSDSSDPTCKVFHAGAEKFVSSNVYGRTSP